MFKIRFTGANEISILDKKEDKKYDKEVCGNQKTFSEDCFKGDRPKKDPKKPDKVVIAGKKEASQYSPSKESKINNLTVTLKVDLGGNIWIMGAIDKDTLIMFKVRFTGASEVSILDKKEDKKYDKEVCGKQKTFSE